MQKAMNKVQSVLRAHLLVTNYARTYSTITQRAWSTIATNAISAPTPGPRYPKAPTAVDRSFSTTAADIMSHFKGKELEGRNIESAMMALANADAVCFDVDSTVIQEEGIDVLADSLGKGEEVSAWTRKAMEGDTKFEDALAARLDIIQPSRASILKCLEDHPLELSPGVERLVELLMENGTDVYLVSGGFRIMIEPVAKTLCIAKDNIVANTIFFDEETNTGEYAGFCRDEPTSADMGKPKAVQMIKDEFGYKTVVMVGDGATDAQAKPPADAFIGFGGVAVRDAVREKACWFVHDFQGMIDVVEKFGRNMK
jgi:phosphoserine phosphatase